jgi:hypothetical protein
MGYVLRFYILNVFKTTIPLTGKGVKEKVERVHGETSVVP